MSTDPLRVVIDTNLVLSALVFSRGRVARLRQIWQSARIQPLISKPTAAELIRVLAYPKFKLQLEEQQELLADYLPWCTSIILPKPLPKTPACRDLHDLPFLQLALVGKADCLLSGDQDLLCLNGKFICPIITVDYLDNMLEPI